MRMSLFFRFDRLEFWSYCRRTNGETAPTPMTSLPLLLDIVFSHPKLIGIARIAAEAESLREGHNVEYFALGTRSLLSRVVSGRNLPFTWAINPYRGCEFACKYCYARYTHEFMELRDAWTSNERFSSSSKRRGFCDPS